MQPSDKIEPMQRTARERPAIATVPRQNAFGHPLASLPAVLQDREVFSLARDILSHEARLVGGTADKAAIERLLLDLKLRADWSVDANLRARFREIMGGDRGFSQIRDLRVRDILAVFDRFVVGPALGPSGRAIDLGCGHGLVAEGLRRRCPAVEELTYADIVDYRDESLRGEPFVLLPERGRLPFEDRSFDSVLLVTVLHHAIDPISLLGEAVRICRGRVYIMESLVGVRSNSRTALPLEGPVWSEYGAFERQFASMSIRQQAYHASLQDWFYNDVVQGGVDVPMNFATNDDWLSALERLNWCTMTRELLGYDQLTAPEYHAIYVSVPRGAPA